MINGTALTVQQGAVDKNRHNATYEELLDKGLVHPEAHFYNRGGLAGVQYYDGKQEAVAMYIDAQWEFEEFSDALIDCEFILDALDEALMAQAPYFAFGEWRSEGYQGSLYGGSRCHISQRGWRMMCQGV